MSTDDTLYFVEVIPNFPCEKMIDVFDNEEEAHDFIAYVRKLDPQHRIEFWRGTSRSIPSSYTDIPMDFEYHYHF